MRPLLPFRTSLARTRVKAAYIEKTGPPEVIVYGELPKPTPADRQVLVRVEAVAVNPIDTYLRSGLVAAPLRFPHIIGADLAGVVEAVGPGVTRYRPGDRVWGSNQQFQGRAGTFAEFAAVDEQWLYPLPDGVAPQQAAAVALVGLTAWLGLHRVNLKSGQTLFVNGGTGGVGSAVVQMAKAKGARAITTAGNEERCAMARSLGADVALVYHAADLDEKIRAAAPQGIDVWWETQREPNFDRAVALLAMRGQMVLMAGRESRPAFPVGPFYVKDCALHGFAMFNAPAELQQEAAREINAWLVAGTLRPQIGRELKLSQAAEAHRLQEENTLGKQGTLAGKIVLTP